MGGVWSGLYGSFRGTGTLILSSQMWSPPLSWGKHTPPRQMLMVLYFQSHFDTNRSSKIHFVSNFALHQNKALLPSFNIYIWEIY